MFYIFNYDDEGIYFNDKYEDISEINENENQIIIMFNNNEYLECIIWNNENNYSYEKLEKIINTSLNHNDSDDHPYGFLICKSNNNVIIPEAVYKYHPYSLWRLKSYKNYLSISKDPIFIQVYIFSIEGELLNVYEVDSVSDLIENSIEFIKENFDINEEIIRND